MHERPGGNRGLHVAARLALDPAGRLHIVDDGGDRERGVRLRRLESGGGIVTVAGRTFCDPVPDTEDVAGPPTKACLRFAAVAFDPAGRPHIATGVP